MQKSVDAIGAGGRKTDSTPDAYGKRDSRRDGNGELAELVRRTGKRRTRLNNLTTCQSSCEFEPHTLHLNLDPAELYSVSRRSGIPGQPSADKKLWWKP